MVEKFEYPRWLDELWANEQRLRRLAENMGDAGFAARGPHNSWAAAQCLEHLVLTIRHFLPLWDQAIAQAQPGPGTAYYAWWEKQFLAFMEPPYRIKAKTNQPFQPRAVWTREESLELYLAAHELVKERAERLKDLAIANLTIASPFAPWMKYNLAFSFDLLLAHERRHLWQAEQNLPQLSPAANLATQQP
ncbi:MAG: DinB family protein [Bryobacter sp.]|nr:DinB family protein [Bryobacter sp.]